MKRTLIFLISLSLPLIFAAPSFITFIPTHEFSIFFCILLSVILVLCLYCYCFGYGSTFLKLKTNLSQKGLFFEVLGYLNVAIFAGVLGFSFFQLAAISTYYFAHKPYSENIFVKNIVCSTQDSQAGAQTKITFVLPQNDHNHLITTAQDLCLQNPSISNLMGQNITLHGRQGFLGATVDGLQFQSYQISLKNNMPSLQPSKWFNPALGGYSIGQYFLFGILAVALGLFSRRMNRRR